ncbi:MAG: hypothetical protein JKX68_06120 [Flavobacteriales bacterium]|nr:hypothetical protein [Flavobacteriales bacterium]
MKKLLFILSLCISINATAQEDAIKSIHTYYKTISKQIEACKKTKKDTSCLLYCNTNITNSGNNEWTGSGNYKKEVQFWYEDNPKQCDSCGENGVNVLKKVISSEQAGLTTYYKEFLYDDGKLTFYYIKITGEQQIEEYRYYYQNDILIKHIEIGNTMNGEEAAKRFKELILQKSKFLQKEFILSFI